MAVNKINFNSDLAERDLSFYQSVDLPLISHINSANIGCLYHGGLEEVIQKEEKREWKQSPSAKGVSKPLKVNEIVLNPEERIPTKNEELDNVLGGGLVRGSITLLGGEPGIGKSTIAAGLFYKLKKKKLMASMSLFHLKKQLFLI